MNTPIPPPIQRPPPLPPRPSFPFTVYAAKASLVGALFVFFFIMFAGRTMAEFRVAFETFALVVLVAGLLSGIVSLFGIPKHGVAKILAPALVGILINGLLLIIFVSNFMAARARVLAQQQANVQTATPSARTPGAKRSQNPDLADQVIAELEAALKVKSPIKITPAIRSGQVSRLNPDVYPVSFTLDDKYQLTSIKVVALAEALTNRSPRPLWHMVGDPESVPTRMFIYGTLIQGMKPVNLTHHPDPLHPDVAYRLLIEAGDRKGQVDFRTFRANKIPPQQNPDRQTNELGNRGNRTGMANDCLPSAIIPYKAILPLAEMAMATQHYPKRKPKIIPNRV